MTKMPEILQKEVYNCMVSDEISMLSSILRTAAQCIGRNPDKLKDDERSLMSTFSPVTIVETIEIKGIADIDYEASLPDPPQPKITHFTKRQAEKVVSKKKSYTDVSIDERLSVDSRKKIEDYHSKHIDIWKRLLDTVIQEKRIRDILKEGGTLTIQDTRVVFKDIKKFMSELVDVGLLVGNEDKNLILRDLGNILRGKDSSRRPKTRALAKSDPDKYAELEMLRVKSAMIQNLRET